MRISAQMADPTQLTLPFDRTLDQAVVALKKGAHLLKCRRRGKPKFCPFRLTTDEKFLVWYSGEEEKILRLSSVTKIIPGQVNCPKQLPSETEFRSFSLVYYLNGARSLDLICKDKAQADTWILGLKAVISRSHHPRLSGTLRNHKGAQSCVSSPAGYFRRKLNLGIPEESIKNAQVRSLCGSPPHSLSERGFSDGSSYSSDGLYLWESSQSNKEMHVLPPKYPNVETDDTKKREALKAGTDLSCRCVVPARGSPQIEKIDTLRDIMVWGKGIEGGYIGRAVCNNNEMPVDALLPRLLESTAVLDVQNISLGSKHAALATRQGEVFCWGEGSNGKLGHKVNMDVSYPKIVESLSGVHVRSVTCGEYQTCALSHSGELYTWGDSGYGAAVGEKTESYQWLPHKLSGALEGISISKVACGEWHTAIVSTSGQLFTYGDGTFGVLGHGTLQSVFQPKEVESLKGFCVKSVACGPWHTAAIVNILVHRFKYNTTGGKLFTWGDGDKGRLGHADGERRLTPTCVAQLVDNDFVQISCGRMLTVGLTNLGAVYTVGSAVHGQLGNSQAKDKSITIVQDKLKGEKVKEISSGSYHIAALTANGGVYTWGKGTNGQLGLGDIGDRSSPTLVEALRDRQVESIICGSSFTAAICLHKSVSISDQSTCSGCKMTFGFTRKKRYCYNCGLQFCSACCSKKVLSASLAPNKSKPFRVCHLCYNHLQRIKHSIRDLKIENQSPRQLLTTQKTFSDESSNMQVTNPTQGQLFSINDESQCAENKTIKRQEENQQFYESISHQSDRRPSWGQVSCPSLFSTHSGEDSMTLIPLSEPISPLPKVSMQRIPLGSKPMISDPMDAKTVLSEPDKMLIEEIQRLTAEVSNLEKQCRRGSNEIQECRQKIEETWLVAREEAARCKAAKDVIRALTSSLLTLSEKHPADGEAKDKILKALPRIKTKVTENQILEGLSPVFVPPHLPSEVLKDGQTESLNGSPIVFSNALKSLYGYEACCGDNKVESCVAGKDSKQNGARSLKPECVEQYEPGVYLTFVTLPSGQKGLKRVRFSRRLFSEKEAARWWEENQQRVYQNYDTVQKL